MLITLSVNSIADKLKGRHPAMTLYEVPAYTLGELEIRGLCLQTSFLAGWDVKGVDRLRDEADRAGCPWLTLVEESPHDLGAGASGDEAIVRMEKVLRVGHRLGCSSVAMGVKTKASSDEDEVAQRLKRIVTAAERLELNLLLIPQPGLTETPEQLTGMIRKVGGFRIGSMPDFEVASKTSDPDAYLRSLTPYASAVCAAISDFDFDSAIEAVKSVGYEGALALEYRLTKTPIEEGLPPVLEKIGAILETEA
ncbi:MAG: hypothetical protein Tsb0013_00700 [Phycisphaerales bacterium]